MDGDNGLSLCHPVYPGNRADAEELPRSAVAYRGSAGPQSDCPRLGNAGARQRGSAALRSQYAGVGKGGSGLDFSFALEPERPRNGGTRSVEQVARLRQFPARRQSGRGEDVRAWQREYLCVLKYSRLALPANNSTALPLRSPGRRRNCGDWLAAELSRPQARFTEQGIRGKIHRWLLDPFVRQVLRYGLEQRENRWHLTFEGGQPCAPAVVVGTPGPHGVDHQPLGLDSRTGGSRIFRPATDRASVSRSQRR